MRVEGSEPNQPMPPCELRIQATLGTDTVLLAWKPPQLDAMGHSNGVRVTGYQVLAFFLYLFF